MARQHFWIAILGLAIINGIFSPLLVVVAALWQLWFPAILPTSAALVFFLASMIVSTLTLMVSGLPAALYERLTGAGESTGTSLYIWLAVMAVLSLPAINNVIAVMRA